VRPASPLLLVGAAVAIAAGGLSSGPVFAAESARPRRPSPKPIVRVERTAAHDAAALQAAEQKRRRKAERLAAIAAAGGFSR